jgi:mono/diheme cytochrome c family protein
LDVNGKTYDMEMPGFGRVLSDEDAASLLTFVRVHFGAPSEPIAADAVRAARAANQNRQDYWSVSELLEK